MNIKREVNYSRGLKNRFMILYVFLQETFCTKTFEHFFKTNWMGEIRHSVSDSNQSRSRGVAIPFKNGFPGKILNSFSSNDGQIILVNCEINQSITTLVSVCAPAIESEKESF